MCDSDPKNFQLAYRLAREKLSGMDIKRQCFRSGAQYVPPDRVTIEYLNQLYVISIPGMEISLRDSLSNCEGQERREEIDLTDRILILHYLITAKGTPLTGKLIGFRQVPGGLFEYASLSREVLAPLLDQFRKEPKRMVEAAANLGGSKAGYGDAAVSIKAFPNVPVVIVLWRGDDEFAPNASMLFDSTVADYLSTEDMSVLCARIVEKLTHSGRKKDDPPGSNTSATLDEAGSILLPDVLAYQKGSRELPLRLDNHFWNADAGSVKIRTTPY